MHPKIVWNESFSVGNPILDRQHQQLFALLQKAADCVQDDSPDNRDVFHSVLNDVFVYTSTHFRAEEVLLDQCGYPDLEAHKDEHFLFVEQIAELNFAAGLGDVCKRELRDTCDTLFLLLSRHILASDRQCSSYLKLPATR